MRSFFSYSLYMGVSVLVNIIIVSYSIIAALIGAGFASGQEMLCYFTAFGRWGIVGIITSLLAFALFIYAVLTCVQRRSFADYNDFLGIFRHRTVRKAVKIITVIFAFAVYGTMLSAFAEILNELFGLRQCIGALLCAVGATVVFSLGTERVFAANGILGVILVFLMIFSCLYMLCYREFHVFSAVPTSAAANGLIYSGYNLVSLTPVLISLSKRLKSTADTVSVTLSSALLTGVIMILVFCLLSIYTNRIPLGELPMLTLAKRQSNAFALCYTVILACAVITTLLSSGGGIVDSLGIKNKPISIAFISAAAYFMSGVGFGRLIDTAYRFCGIVGIFVSVLIIVGCMRKFRYK